MNRRRLQVKVWWVRTKRDLTFGTRTYAFRAHFQFDTQSRDPIREADTSQSMPTPSSRA